MPLHNRRAAATSNASVELGDSTIENSASATKGHRNSNSLDRSIRQWIQSIKKTATFKVLLPIAGITIFVIHRLVLHEYAWVYQRCLVAFVVPTIPQKVVCQEAWSHMVANYDPALLWPESLVASFSVSERTAMDDARAQVRRTVAQGQESRVTNVHLTLTAALHVTAAQDLGRCSIESVARFCKGTGSLPSCRINIWVVDSAAAEFAAPTDGSSANSIVEYLGKLVGSIRSTKDEANAAPPYCIRVIRKPDSYDDTEYDSTLVPNATVGCPAPNARSLGAGRRMREWLGSEAAKKQIPEHASDAWRLVALFEWGGLYLDLDVLPLSPLLLRLPKDSVPVQHRVGAYRMNGGVLRLGDGLDEETNWAKTYLEEQQVGQGGDASVSLRRNGRGRRRTFLEALEEDHMFWAPLLASLPLEEQKFGFLGPAALTRTFTSHAYIETVTVLPKEAIEPIQDETMCSRWMENMTLAMHFSGKRRKAEWMSIVKRKECIQQLVYGVCPHTMQGHNQINNKSYSRQQISNFRVSE